MAAQSSSANDIGWKKVFAALPILETIRKNGFFDITADEIKEISGREPRLMTKIDFRSQLPEPFEDNGLSILAISNGLYRIASFDPFINIKESPPEKVKSLRLPENLLTLTSQGLNHESAVLDAALISGALENVFGEPIVLTLRGRTRSPAFSFTLGEVSFPVEGVQIEIDGGYEGKNSINLIEAKIGTPDNLSLRQILYPYLAWNTLTGQKKLLRVFACFYQEPYLRFLPIEYDGATCQVDYEHEKFFCFEEPAHLDLKTIPVSTTQPPVLGIPFPQADSFETALAMLSLLAEHGEMKKDDILQHFYVVPRQIDYYSNVLCWMGLATTKRSVVSLTALGKEASALPHREKIQKLAHIVFGEPIFNKALHEGIEKVDPLLFKRWNCTRNTVSRRLQTVAAWIRYFKQFE